MDWEWVANAIGAFNAATAAVSAHAWAAKLVALVAFILLMVMVVALLYSGEVQNSEKGPISIRAKSSLDDHSLQAPDPIVTNNLDDKRAFCTFYLSYVDRRGRPRRKRLYRSRFAFKKLNRGITKDRNDLVGYWNPQHHDTIFHAVQESGVIPDSPNLYSAGTSSQPELPPHIEQYFTREIAETKIIAVSSAVAKEIGKRHAEFMQEKFNKLARVKPNKRGRRKLDGRHEYETLPNLAEDGHYFVEMKFSINPIFVLTEHPDGQVKTTAWLTVLTSLFAIFMQAIYNGLG